VLKMFIFLKKIQKLQNKWGRRSSSMAGISCSLKNFKLHLLQNTLINKLYFIAKKYLLCYPF